MMLPRRVPFIGAVPLPMISSWPRSAISPTSTHTFDVPMSSATMYFSSFFGMAPSLVRDLHRNHRARRARGRRHLAQWLHHHASVESEIGIGDLAGSEALRGGDRVELAPLCRHVLLVRIDERAHLPVEKCKTTRRHRAHLGDARVQLRIGGPKATQHR